jgi:hypothetical protein
MMTIAHAWRRCMRGRLTSNNCSQITMDRYLVAPLPMLRLVPTGGIDSAYTGTYLNIVAVAVGISGGRIVPDAVVRGDRGRLALPQLHACTRSPRGLLIDIVTSCSGHPRRLCGWISSHGHYCGRRG